MVVVCGMLSRRASCSSIVLFPILSALVIAMSCTIESVYRVTFGKNEAAWFINDTEIVEGVTFVPLSKTCNGFARFVTGDGKGLRQLGWLEEARALRNAASVHDALEEGIGVFGLKKLTPQVVRAKARQLKNVDRDACKPIVTVEFHAVKDGDTVIAEAINMRMKNTTKVNEPIAVELTDKNLSYVKAALIHGPLCAKRAKSSDDIPTSSNARWRAKRNAYVVELREPDVHGRKYKTLKLKSFDDESFQRAHDKATRIADGDCAEEQSGGEGGDGHATEAEEDNAEAGSDHACASDEDGGHDVA